MIHGNKNKIRHKNLLILAFIQLFIVSASRFIVGPIIPLISSELEMSLSILGGAISLNVFILLVSTLIAGNLIELFGLKRILYIAMILQIAVFVGFYFINSALSFIILNSLLGIGGGLLTVCLIAIANVNRENKKTRGFFNLFLGAALALALSPLFTMAIGYYEINWRNIFILFGLFQIALLIGFLFSRVPESANSVLDINKMIEANKVFFKSPTLIICFLFNLFNAPVVETFYTWFTSYLSDFDVNINISSFILFLFSLSVFIGIFIKKYLVRYINEKKMLFFNVLFSIIFLTLTLLLNSLLLKTIVIFLFGFSLSANYILIISMGLKDLKEKYGTASGYLQGAEFVGIIIFQSVAGLLSEHLIAKGIIYMNLVILALLFVIIVIINLKKDFNIKNSF
jgi:predicted MFS family arabinose efflux permease